MNEARPTLEVFVDGGSRGNPGPAGGGFAVFLNKKPLFRGHVFFGYKTNNQAEYLALIEALSWVVQHHAHAQVRCFMDSQLAVEQIAGRYKVKNAGLKPLHQQALALISQLAAFDIYHIPREQNRLADALANEAMDEGG